VTIVIIGITLLAYIFIGGTIFNEDRKYSQPDINYVGNITISNGTVYFDGTLYGFDYRVPRDYHNVTFCMYDVNGELLRKHSVGTISPGGKPTKVNFNVSLVPHYILIRGSDLWEGPNPTIFRANYFVRDKSATPSGHYHITGYRKLSVSDPEQYPIDRVDRIC
jgi:hypothetical protein